MSDAERHIGSADRDRINVDEDDEVQYWTNALQVTADELRSAVAAVGPIAEAVRRYLCK